MTRPLKLTPEVQERIALLVSEGLPLEVAAKASGVAQETVSRWIARGERAGTTNAPYRDFREAVERARADAEGDLVASMRKAASKGSWGAAAWLLERTNAERWVKPDGRVKKTPEPAVKKPADPFEEVDELASRRRA